MTRLDPAGSPGRPLTSEQLQEIGAALHDDEQSDHSALCIATCFWRDEARVLLAEVHRLRAETFRLREAMSRATPGTKERP